MDERIRFVIRLNDGESMAALCREFQISREIQLGRRRYAVNLLKELELTLGHFVEKRWQIETISMPLAAFGSSAYRPACGKRERQC
jgi:hypothetical protein